MVEFLAQQSKLYEFHKIQELALNGDISKASSLLKMLLESKPWAESTIPEDWWNYLRATSAYLSGDCNLLKDLLPKCDINIDVVLRLLQGLTVHGNVNYKRDYLP